MQTHKQMHLRSLNLTLICQSCKGDEWEGVCSAQEDVRISKSPRDLPQSWPTSIYRRPQHEIAVRHLTLLLLGWLDVSVDLTIRGHNVRSHLAPPPDVRHVSGFKSRSFDRNGHLNEVSHAQKWPNAPLGLIGHALASGRQMLALLRGLTWAPLVLTGHTTTWHPIEYRKLPERVFHDQTRPFMTDRTRHSVRSILLNALLLWMLMSHRPNAPVCALPLHVGWTDWTRP
jgi:hypothetical protein